MKEKQARKVVRKQRRKDILQWYRFLKYQMKQSYNIQNGFYLGLSYYELPSFGCEQGARLLCFKNKNFTIIEKRYTKTLVWKFNYKNK
jgi:hypothetical protein